MSLCVLYSIYFLNMKIMSLGILLIDKNKPMSFSLRDCV
jgi:hypothetical protein